MALARTSGHPFDDCDVKFVNGATVAEYVLHPWPGDAAPFNPGPAIERLSDSQVCGSFSPIANCGAVVVSGPAPAFCRRSSDCIDLGFDGAMRQFLGSSTYDVRLTCGKDLIVGTSGLDSNRQQCAL